jgi:hypothetical protein
LNRENSNSEVHTWVEQTDKIEQTTESTN